jgi:hypothetical protein
MMVVVMIAMIVVVMVAVIMMVMMTMVRSMAVVIATLAVAHIFAQLAAFAADALFKAIQLVADLPEFVLAQIAFIRRVFQTACLVFEPLDVFLELVPFAGRKLVLVALVIVLQPVDFPAKAVEAAIEDAFPEIVTALPATAAFTMIVMVVVMMTICSVDHRR